MKKQVSNSEIECFLDCRQKHQWDYTERWRPKVPATALWLGSLVHLGLAAYHEGKDYLNVYGQAAEDQIIEIEKKQQSELWDEEKAELRKQADLGAIMLKGYAEFDKEQEPKFKTLNTELKLEFKIPNSHCWYYFTIDRVVMDEYGHIWIGEYKTCKGIQTNHLELDQQAARYIWGIQKLIGKKVKGVIYDFLRKAEPKPIKYAVIQKSKDKALKVFGVRDEAIGYLQSKAKTMDNLEVSIRPPNQAPLFHREIVTRNQNEINNIMQRTYDIYREIYNPKKRIYKSPSKDCGWKCQFFNICLAHEDGSDFEYMLNEKFEREV